MTIIQVTRIHTEVGRRGDTYRCPVALALRDVLAEEVRISVLSGCVHLTADGRRTEIPFPLFVREAIAKYDADNLMEPMSFSLDIPWQLLKSRVGYLTYREVVCEDVVTPRPAMELVGA